MCVAVILFFMSALNPVVTGTLRSCCSIGDNDDICIPDGDGGDIGADIGALSCGGR